MNKDVLKRREAVFIYNNDYSVECWRITGVNYDRQDE